MACVSLTENAWRMQTLDTVARIEDVVAMWSTPAVDPGADPRALYDAECERVNVRPNKTIRKLLDAGATSLDISRQFVGTLGLLPLFAVLPLLTSLQHLSLADCHLESPLVVILGQFIAEHPTLRTLDLSRNPFSSLGAQALLEAVSKNTRVHGVALGGVELTPGLLRKIGDRLERNAQSA